MVTVFINDRIVKVKEAKHFFSSILPLVGIHRPVLLPVLKERIQVVFDLVLDFCEMSRDQDLLPAKKAQLTRTMNRIKETRRYWDRIRDMETFLSRYFDLVLSLERLNTLSNFGFSNRFGDHLKGNAERTSVIGAM